MKRWPVVILVLISVLGAVVPGCNRVPRYDGRLTVLDSLMRGNLDSVVAVLEALTTDSLASEGDRAYRDLLLTQARYKAYITATSDSDINRALAYFSAHPADREKLTRAYIYKGAVMDELGHPDSAMLYYKHAEATAAPDDYFNLGYTKMRIATLYQDQLSLDSAAVIRFKQAIKCFEMVKDTSYIISCYGHLGGIIGLIAPDSTEYYLKQAIRLAQLSNSTKQYTYKSTLSGFYFYHYKNYPQAKDLAMDVMRNGKEFSTERQFYYYAALSYIRMGMLDSALCVFEATPNPIDAVDSMNRFHVIAEIKKAKKDITAFGLNMARSKEAKIQVMESKDDTKLKVTEMAYEKEQHISKTTERNNRLMAALLISSILILLLVFFVIHQRRIVKDRKNEIETIKKLLSDNINELEEKKQQLEQTKCTISEIFGYRISAMNELFDSIKFKSKEDNNNRIRRIIPLSSVIIDLCSTHTVVDVKLSDSFWDKMKRSVDAEYKGIASYIETNYSDLTIKEKRLFCLLCAKIPPQVIKLCLNYSNVKSISNSINIIIKKKIGLDASLDEFIEKFMKYKLK